MEIIHVADVMTRDPMTARPDDDLLKCSKKMVKKRVGSLVLVDEENKVVGFLSQKDILWAIVKKSKKDLKNISAKQVAAKKVVTIRPDADIREAVKKMEKKKFDRLPVVLKGKKLVGIVTVKDILSFQPEIYPELEEYAKIREEQEKLKRIKHSKNREFMHEGVCEECGETDLLYKIDGRIICESCMNDM